MPLLSSKMAPRGRQSLLGGVPKNHTRRLSLQLTACTMGWAQQDQGQAKAVVCPSCVSELQHHCLILMAMVRSRARSQAIFCYAAVACDMLASSAPHLEGHWVPCGRSRAALLSLCARQLCLDTSP